MASSSSVLWRRVLGLGALQGAITLGWLIYNLYLPELLGDLGVSAALIATLLVLEGFVGFVMEPLVGFFSDKLHKSLAGRFLWVMGGALLAGALFVAIPL